MEGDAPAPGNVEHSHRLAGRGVPQLDCLGLVSRRDDQGSVGREEHAVDAPFLPAWLHANLPALGAGRHLTGDQVGGEVSGDHQAAIGAQADGVRQRLEGRELKHSGGDHRGRLRCLGTGPEAQREGNNNGTHNKNSK
jgi:hypothetical protein